MSASRAQRALLPTLLLMVFPAYAADTASQAKDLTLLEVQQAALDLVNLATTPGIESSFFRIENDGREADLVRSNAGFGAELAIRDKPFSVYYGAALAGAYLEEKVLVEDAAGPPVRFDVDRSITALQVSGGLVTQFNQFLRLRSYLSASYARLGDQTGAGAASGRNLQLNGLPPSVDDWEADALSGYGTLEAIYDRWYDQRRLEITGLYNLGYSELDSSTDGSSDASAWSRTAVLRARLSGPTQWQTEGRNWRWTAYFNHTRFPGQDKAALGFKYYSELGAGISWDWNIKPLDMFGLRAIGFGGGIIFGDDVRGATLGFSFK